jgi:hypothetical protein
MNTDKVIALCLRETISLERAENPADGRGFDVHLAEDAIEDMVVCLAAVEASWTASEFGRLSTSLAALRRLAITSGLPDVVFVVDQASELIETCDAVALAAVIARLVRVGETSLAALLEISYRQI